MISLCHATWISVVVLGCSSSGSNGDGGTAADSPGATVLPVDCRASNDDMRCSGFSDVPEGTIGAGVGIPQGTGALFGGFVDAGANRIVLAGYDYMDQGYVFAVDLTSGDRTLLSGTRYDTRTGNETRGAGPELGQVYDVDRGPDGRLFTFGENGIHAIDLASGDRTEIVPPIVPPGPNACMHAGRVWLLANSTGTDIPGLAIGADGSLYVPTKNPYLGMDSQSHAGIARIALDGTCTILTLSSENPDYRIGDGPEADRGANGMSFDGDRLYWTTPGTGNVFSLDVTTGMRALVASGAPGMEVGSGMSPDQGFVVAFDDHTLWTSGDTSGLERGGRALIAVDIATGNRTDYAWDDDGPLGGFNQAWWAYPHPTMPGVAIVGAGLGGLDHAIVLFELGTGNHYLLSR